MKNLFLKNIFTLIVLFCSSFALASLSDRLLVEENIRNQLQDYLNIYDHQVKVTIKFDYKVYSETLPGTHLSSENGALPNKIESTDIRKVSVNIYSGQIKELSEDLKTTLFELIPVKKSIISINLKNVKPYIPPSDHDKNEEPMQSFNKASSQWINTFTQVIYLSFSAIGILGMTLFVLLFLKREKTIKNQVSAITNAIAEASSPVNNFPAHESFGYEEKHFNTDLHSDKVLDNAESEIQQLPLISLYELFSDCYWCEKDGQAHWLWNHILPETKSALLKELTYMKEYSAYFINLKPELFDEYKNPFYLQPVSCRHLSMQDLMAQIKKDMSRWHQLSPIRQAHMPFNLKDKITAISSKVKFDFLWENLPASSPRLLTKVLAPIYLTEAEETSVFSNPESIPPDFYNSIISLCWLALLDNNDISKVLERFDARSLAEAWIAAPTILDKLSSILPEKKLKALNSYRSRLTVNKKSTAYASLVQIGAQLYSQKKSQLIKQDEAA